MTRSLTALALALALSSCGGGEEPPASGGGVDLQAAGDALCQAESFAAQGDIDGARTSFADAHDAAHDLAADLQERDRELAGELLRAKQQVEEYFSAPEEAEVAAARLSELRGVFEAGAALMGTPVTGCAM